MSKLFIPKSIKAFLETLHCGTDGIVKIQESSEPLPEFVCNTRNASEYFCASGNNGFTGYTGCTGASECSYRSWIVANDPVNAPKLLEEYNVVPDYEDIIVYIKGTFPYIPVARKKVIANQSFNVCNLWFIDHNDQKRVYPRLKPEVLSIVKQLKEFDSNFTMKKILVDEPEKSNTCTCTDMTKPVTWHNKYVELVDNPVLSTDPCYLEDLDRNLEPLKTPRTRDVVENYGTTSVIVSINMSEISLSTLPTRTKLKEIFDILA